MVYATIDIEGVEYFVNLGPAIFLADFGSSQPQKLGKIDAPRLILVQLGEYLVDKLILPREAKLQECFLELWGVQHAAAVIIEDIESLFYLDYLLAVDCHRYVFVGVEFLGRRMFHGIM